MEEIKINKHRKSKRTVGFICTCTIPTFLLYAFIVLYPVVYMIQHSFIEWNGLLGDKKFIGWANYTLMFHDETFWLAFKNTLILIVLVTAVTIMLALWFASMLSKSKLRGKAFFRILFYVPNILSIVVISAIFSTLYSPETGLIGPIMKLFGKAYTGVMGKPDQVVYAIGVAMIWQAIGYYMVMYIAGMDSISDEIYESASLEGASKARQFWQITLPLTWQVIRVTLTFFIISTINMSFLFVTAMAGETAEPGGASHVLLTLVNYRRNNGEFGYAMSIATFLFFFAYALALIVDRLTKRDVVEM